MRTVEDQLSQYAAYHRDPRNIATHFIGIPMIVMAVTTLLSRPGVAVAGLALTPAAGVALVTGIYYLRLSRPLGAVMAVLLALAVWFGGWAAGLSTSAWLGTGIGLFVVGWVFQFVGHAWEGRKPAFVDDLIGLVIGPLFVVAEALFAIGLMRGLRDVVEARAGGAVPSRHGGGSAARHHA